jgi:arginase
MLFLQGMTNIRILEVRSELGGRIRGASLGIDAIKMADIAKDNTFFYSEEKNKQKQFVAVKDFNGELLKPSTHRQAKYIDKIYSQCKLIAEATEKCLKDKKFPLVISGDHSNAIGTIAGIKNHYHDARIGVIWVDAHADLHSPYSSPSGNLHGMPMGASLAFDGIKEYRISKREAEFWSKLKCLGSREIEPKILPEDIVYIGLRDTEIEEDELIERNGIKVIDPIDFRSMSIKEVANETLKHLAACDYLYISFDIDSLDKSLVPGTGTPVDSGLSELEAKKLLQLLLKDERLCCFELTEVNPLLDIENKTAKMALEIIDSLF